MLGFSPLASAAVASTADAGTEHPASASIVGSASVALAGELVGNASAAISGGSEVSSDAIILKFVSGDLVGSAALVGEAYRLHSLALNAVGTGTLLGEATLARYGPILVRTPRPPVGLNLAGRTTVDASDWQTITQTFEYAVPALPPDSADTVRANRFILTSAIATTEEALGATIELRIVDAQNDPFGFTTKLISAEIGVDGFTTLPVKGMVLSSQEIIEARAVGGGSVDVSVGIVANTVEQFDVIS